MQEFYGVIAYLTICCACILFGIGLGWALFNPRQSPQRPAETLTIKVKVDTEQADAVLRRLERQAARLRRQLEESGTWHA